MMLSTRLLCTAALGCTAFAAQALAIDDVAPVDPRPILEALKTIKDQQASVVKTNKARFIQEATAAASNPARAVELWEEAIRATQFQGVAKENAAWREWKDKEGDALKDKEVQFALHLYFNWLSLTLQRSSGVEIKNLFNPVLNHAHELLADQTMMDAFEDTIKKDVPPPANAPKRPTAATAREKEKKSDAQAIKKMHDQILKQPLSGSAFVQWMRLGEYITDVAPAPAPKRGGGGGGGGGGKGRPDGGTRALDLTQKVEEGATSWEGTPGSYDGIYSNILLPEMRANKDVRVLEYWDNKLKREAEAATKGKLTFDIDKFNQVRRPQIIWSRDEDMIKIGQRNRAINDMFTEIKTYPTHPDGSVWVSELEALLTPQPAPTLAPEAAPAADPPAVTPAALPGAQ